MTIQHALQQFNPGMVWLDTENRILAMNPVASETLGSIPGAKIGAEVLQLHPEGSREKVRWMIDNASCPMESPPPVTMMINIPEQVLLVKVSMMAGEDGQKIGTCMIFYDVTTETLRPRADGVDDAAPQELYKVPVSKHNRVLFVEAESVSCIKADGRYSTVYTSDEHYFCNLSLSELERRLDQNAFHRLHRSYIVNFHAVKEFEKTDEHSYLIIDHLDGIQVPISRNKMAEIKSRLGLS